MGLGVSDNPIIRRLARDAVKPGPAYRASKGLEKKVAAKFGGHRTAGSGNKKEKGDVRVKNVARIEHKATKHDSFRVTKEMIDTIELAARGCDEMPIIIVELVDPKGKPTHSIACIRVDDLEELLAHAKLAK